MTDDEEVCDHQVNPDDGLDLDVRFPHWAQLTCGCRITTHFENKNRVVYYQPCSLDCKYYKLILDISELNDKPVVWRSADVN